MAKPKIGDPVLISGRNHNGSLVHPGIITRVWDDGTVNVCMFPDAGASYPLTSVRYSAKPLATEDSTLVASPSPSDDGKVPQEAGKSASKSK